MPTWARFRRWEITGFCRCSCKGGVDTDSRCDSPRSVPLHCTYFMPTLTNLDLDTLRTFSVAHDLGGLAQAAERLGRTPSAISLQMKRLQDELGTPLFRKRGRGLALTEAGEVAF